MTGAAIRALLREKHGLEIDPLLGEQLAGYLALLLKWNARTNLTALRTPEEIILRHFSESLQCAQALPDEVRSLLDFGSGAGFPGAVCALARPAAQVTLAESQGKKAAFLAELARVLNMKTTIHSGRVESLPAGARFDVVTLRAVDRMEAALAAARARVLREGWLVLLTTDAFLGFIPPSLTGVSWSPPQRLRGTEQGVIALGCVHG